MRGLKKSEEYEHLYQTLGNKNNKFFDSMRDVYTLSTLIGALMDRKKGFENSGGDAIKDNLFKRFDKSIFDFVVIDKKKELDLLKDEVELSEEKAVLIESYANGGIEFLEENLGIEYLDLDNLIDAVERIDEKIDKHRNKKDNSFENIFRTIAEEI